MNQRDGADTAEALFQDVYPRLAGWVRRLVADDDTAHEIASEAFARLLSRWTAVEDPHSYLYLVAADLVRGTWRRTEQGHSCGRAKPLPKVHPTPAG
jgi:RNA polymerase sigma-70 factor (ECF subfamily)